MRKILLCVVLCGLGTALMKAEETIGIPSPEKHLTGEMSVGFESEAIEQGSLVGRKAVQPSLILRLPISPDWDLEHRTVGIFPAKNIQLYGNYLHESFGLQRKLNESTSMHSGMTYHWQPSSPKGNLARSREWYVGVDSNLALFPNVYAYYDFDKQQWSSELNFGYRFELEGFGFKQWAIDTNAFGGVLFARNVYGSAREGNRRKNGYKYWGVKCDLVYLISHFGEMSVGFRYTANNDGGKPDSVANEHGQHGKMFSVGTALSVHF